MRATCFLTSACVCLLAAASSSAAEPPAKEAAKRKPARPKITISKETTYITSPLRADGYPDYLAALNALGSRGVTPENNAAVPFWRAVGPKSISAELRPQFFKLLGIEELPEKGAYIMWLEEYGEQEEAAGKAAGKQMDYTGWYSDLMEKRDHAMSHPWSAVEHPHLAAWLKINEAPVQVLIEGLKRPRFYWPLVVKEAGSLLDSNFADGISEERELCRLLTLRAMLRLKGANTDEAWQDLLACHRLARLVGQKPFLVDQLIAGALESVACQGDAVLAHHGNLTAKQAAEYLADLNELPPISQGAAIVDFGERYFGLDAILLAAHKGTGPDYADFFEDEAVSKVTNDAITKLVADPRVDWNVVLREMNAGYDRLVEAHQRPTYKQRRETAAIEKKTTAKQKREMTQPTVVAKALEKDATPQSIGRHLGIVLRASFTGAYEACLVAETRHHTQVSLVQLAFALAGYRADHGKYPASLAELKPKYIAEILKDLFTDKDLIYKPQDGGKGYVLYSLGSNGRDDGALNASDDDSGKYDNVDFDKRPDDIVIRTPPPAASEAKK